MTQEQDPDKNLKVSIFFCGPKPTQEELDAFGNFVLSEDIRAEGYTAEVTSAVDLNGKFVVTKNVEEDVKVNGAALKEILTPGAFFLNPSEGLIEIVKLLKLESGIGAIRSVHDENGKFIRWTVVW